MNDEAKVYLDLDEKEFDSTKKRAKEDSIDTDPNDESRKDRLMYSNAKIEMDEFYLSDNTDTLELRGILFSPAKEIAYIDLTIPISQELALDIVDRYLKKLGKLKTVLEATK